MAEQLGVSKWTFHRVETGKQPAPANWYVRAASILGVSVDEISPDSDHSERVAAVTGEVAADVPDEDVAA